MKAYLSTKKRTGVITRNRLFSLSAALTIVLLGSLCRLDGAISIITSGSGAGGDIQIVLPEISFLATSNFGGGTSALALVIDEAFPAPVGNDRTNVLGLTVTGPTISTGGSINFYADAGFSAVDLTVNDAYIAIIGGTGAFTAGQTVTLAAGTVAITGGSAPSLDIFPSGSYEVYLWNSAAGGRLSNNGVIPEPSRALLFPIGLGAALARRRRPAPRACS